MYYKMFLEIIPVLAGYWNFHWYYSYPSSKEKRNIIVRRYCIKSIIDIVDSFFLLLQNSFLIIHL